MHTKVTNPYILYTRAVTINRFESNQIDSSS